MFDLKIIVSVCIALAGWMIGLVGWFVVHLLNSKRDVQIKRRELCLQNLIDTYRILTCEITHRELTSKRKRKLEKIIADIQLFGNIEQIEKAKLLVKDISSPNTSFELDPLINCLRDDLRDQLKLSHVNGNVKWLRFSDK